MENPEDNSQRLYSDNTWNVMLAVFAITIFTVIASAITAGNEQLYSAVTLIATVAYGVSILVWCSVDARDRGFPLGFGFRLFIVLFGVLALIFYLFKTRGLREGFVAVGYAFMSSANV